MRLLRDIKTAIVSERMLLLSPFAAKCNRATAALAQVRNHLVTAIADVVFIAYATPGSTTESLAKQAVAWDKPLVTFDSSDNQNLRNLGAQVIDPIFAEDFWTHMTHSNTRASTNPSLSKRVSDYAV